MNAADMNPLQREKTSSPINKIRAKRKKHGPMPQTMRKKQAPAMAPTPLKAVSSDASAY